MLEKELFVFMTMNHLHCVLYCAHICQTFCAKIQFLRRDLTIAASERASVNSEMGGGGGGVSTTADLSSHSLFLI